MARHPAMSVCSSHCFSAAGTPMTHRFQLSASSSNRSHFPLSLPCCLCLYRPLNRGISPSISREIDCTVGQQTLDLDPFCAHFHSEEARRQTAGPARCKENASHALIARMRSIATDEMAWSVYVFVRTVIIHRKHG